MGSVCYLLEFRVTMRRDRLTLSVPPGPDTNYHFQPLDMQHVCVNEGSCGEFGVQCTVYMCVPQDCPEECIGL